MGVAVVVYGLGGGVVALQGGDISGRKNPADHYIPAG